VGDANEQNDTSNKIAWAPVDQYLTSIINGNWSSASTLGFGDCSNILQSGLTSSANDGDVGYLHGDGQHDYHQRTLRASRVNNSTFYARERNLIGYPEDVGFRDRFGLRLQRKLRNCDLGL